ncbi:hypothetical protein SAMN05421854_101327 [Amycolatopsis rubida]|uniref:Uncharacterized protein n=2 Tax=Amycolatopsis rubida TaxID=112413 RepID=A0A1I5DRV1_9PSEU|nr:hypothetical protein SAMN05421854_101327 [Amycolatopsis rubida]
MANPCGLAHPVASGSGPLGNAGSALLGMAGGASNRAERNSSFARAGVKRRPRAWAAPIARPAARIAVAGGLTLAGWLLGAALSQANAATDDHADRPAASAHDTEPEHRYAGTATSGTLTWAMPGAATGAKHASLHRFQISADDYRPDVSFRSATVSGNDPEHQTSAAATRPKITKPAKAKSPGKAKHHAPASDPAPEATTQPGLLGSTSSEPSQGSPGSTSTEPQPGLPSNTSSEPSQDSPGSTSTEPQPGLLSNTSSEPEQGEPRQGLLGGLLGGTGRDSGPGLLGGLLDSPGTGRPGLLDSILGTVDHTVDTTLHTTVTSVDTVIDTAPVRVVEPPVATVEPAPSASGSVSVSVPAAKLAKEPEAPVAVKVSKQAPVVHAASAHVRTAQPAAKQENQPAPPVKEHSQAGGSSGGGEGLPSAPAAPAAPASTVSPGHDGHGGLRQLFALSGDGDTVTQLKLIGVSRDHEVDGAGRDAALPTTSPD